MTTATAKAAPQVLPLPDIDTPGYLAEAREGASRRQLAKNLVESNFHGLRSLRAYTQAGDHGRKAFIRDLAEGKLMESCPFPFEVALLRALHMGFERWASPSSSHAARVEAYMSRVRFGVMCEHLTSVVEYDPEVFFRAFQGFEVHRDVPLLEDAGDGGASLDWSDFRIYAIPELEKDLVWDLFQLDGGLLSGGHAWHLPQGGDGETSEGGKGVLAMGRAGHTEDQPRIPLPLMVGRQRNRARKEKVKHPDEFLVPIHAPSASIHLSAVYGTVDHLGYLFPKLIGPEPVSLVGHGARGVGQENLRDNEVWLVATYTLPTPVADARLKKALETANFTQNGRKNS